MSHSSEGLDSDWLKWVLGPWNISGHTPPRSPLTTISYLTPRGSRNPGVSRFGLLESWWNLWKCREGFTREDDSDIGLHQQEVFISWLANHTGCSWAQCSPELFSGWHFKHKNTSWVDTPQLVRTVSQKQKLRSMVSTCKDFPRTTDINGLGLCFRLGGAICMLTSGLNGPISWSQLC